MIVDGWSALSSMGAVLLATEALDPLAKPCPPRRPVRSLLAWPFRVAPMLIVFGVLLLLTGRPTVSGLVAVLVLVVAVVGSNTKRGILGEPLCFSDLALVREMLRHPGFYLGAVSPLLGVTFVVAMIGMVLLLGFAASTELLPRLVGAIMLVAGCAGFSLSRIGPWRGLACVPDLDRDVSHHGLLATLCLYAMRLRQEPPMHPHVTASRSGAMTSPLPLVVVVQCESFADPHWLMLPKDAVLPAMPGLAAARARAFRSGRLAVTGFGAYTMRAEYGVLFGREEAELGFRRFDPFLSAGSTERAGALPHRFRVAGGGAAAFVHPHSLGFYGRDRLMPALGFDRVYDDSSFDEGALRGPHVSDEAVGDAIVRLLDVPVDEAPDFIYAVTIENHGPWRPGRLPHVAGGLSVWLDHLQEGDRLLSRLVTYLDRIDRPAVLCFFGDHQPSIPGAIHPGPDRDTPFVLLRFGSAVADTDPVTERLTPAALHHAILDAAGLTVGRQV